MNKTQPRLFENLMVIEKNKNNSMAKRINNMACKTRNERKDKIK